MDEEFIKFLGRATAYLFMLSLAALSAGIDKLEEQLDVVFNAWLEKHDLYPNFYTIPAYETYKYIDGKFEREEE